MIARLALLLALAPFPAFAQAILVLEDVSGHAQSVDPATFEKLPQRTLEVAFDTEHGPRKASFTGPLLWDVLASTNTIDPAKARDHVRQTILAIADDKYSALLALGEIDPAFENKAVLLASSMDGQKLTRPRLVVPGETHGGRNEHDVIRIIVDQPPR